MFFEKPIDVSEITNSQIKAQLTNGNNYAHLEICQSLNTAPSGKAIPYLSDFQELP